MASKSKRTAARQSNIQSRKKRKDGGKAAVSTIVKQNLTTGNQAGIDKEEGIVENKLLENSSGEQVQQKESHNQSVEPSLAPKPQTVTKKSKKLVRIAPERYVRGELARIGVISAVIVGLLAVFSVVI